MAAGAARVLVFTESVHDELTLRTREALALGCALAHAEGTPLGAVLLSGKAALVGEAIDHGADVAYLLADPLPETYQPEPYVDLAEQVCTVLAPRIIILPYSPIGRDLAPRLSFRLRITCATGCFRARAEQGRVVVTRAAFAGKLLVESVADLPLLLTMQAGSVSPLGRDLTRSGELRELALAPRSLSQRLRYLAHEEDGSGKRNVLPYVCLNPHCHRAQWNRLCGETRERCPLRAPYR